MKQFKTECLWRKGLNVLSWNTIAWPLVGSALLGISHTAGASEPESAGAAGDYSAAGHQRNLEEVLVTAQKRDERLQDVPVPVTVIDPAALADSNLVRIQDYYTSVPGLSINVNGQGTTQLTIRGLGTGQGTNPTVGIVLDDLPFGSTTALGAGGFTPDIDPGDLARVEVLRGPQGTLYGASSIGGLLKFVTVDPSTEELSGRIQADVNGIKNGSGAGYGVRASGNIPITDSLAIRASAFGRQTPGYIDDPVRHEKGINEDRTEGGRLAALWKPLDIFSLKLSALIQHEEADGFTFTTLPPGGLNQIRALPIGNYEHDVQSYAATAILHLDGVTLTSITGYNTDRLHSISDDTTTSFFGGLAESIYNVFGSERIAHRTTNKFSEEFRLSGSAAARLDYILGLFFTREDTPAVDIFNAVDPATLSIPGLLVNDPYPTTYREYAVFGDLTYHFTDQFDIQLGARESQNKQTYKETLTGPLDEAFGLPDPAIQPAVDTKDSSFTFLVTPRFKLSDEVMIYARIATGYRPGGPNPACVIFPAPCEYAPDKTTNYELGVKAQTPDHIWSFDTSAYYIKWKDIQLQEVFLSSGSDYYANGGGAKSEGFELSVQTRPVTGLTVDGWVDYNHAILTQGFLPPPLGAAVGNPGDQLPYSARFSGNLAAQQDFSLGSDTNGFVGGSFSYIGKRQGGFPGSLSDPRLSLPGYGVGNVHAGVQYKTWTGNVYANNVTDKRAVLSNDKAGTFVDYNLPRTIGLSVSTTFK